MKKWIEAARLRTLPLSLAGIFGGYAISNQPDKYGLFILCVLTAVCLQILSNFANDYGDFTKGTDNDSRVGPQRTMQKGLITQKEMKKVLILFSFLSFFLGITTSLTAFDITLTTLVFSLIGGACVFAAIAYTVGKYAYGYAGLGDLFVFVFFGLVSVLGTKYVLTKGLEYVDIYPAITFGLLSTAVLNLNNMRDIENDKASKKNTLVTKLGLSNAFIYHFALVIGSIVSLTAYCSYTKGEEYYSYLTFIIVPSIIHHLIRLTKKGIYTDFDPELKKVAIPTFILSVLFILQEFLK